MRALVTSLLVLCAGCRCLEPVVEGLDGGAGGGAGGGSGGGMASGGGCESAASCTAALPAQSLCSVVQRDGGYSCLDRTCVYECSGGRTCDTREDAGCLRCGTKRTCEDGPSCNHTKLGSVGTNTACPASLPAQLSLTPIAGACGWTMTDNATGRVVGTVFLLSDGTYLAHIPELGGTCTGFSLATQVERWLLSCAACQFELEL